MFFGVSDHFSRLHQWLFMATRFLGFFVGAVPSGLFAWPRFVKIFAWDAIWDGRSDGTDVLSPSSPKLGA
jgi:hypothetical protein